MVKPSSKNNSKLLQELRAKSQELESTNRRLNRLLREQSALREIFTQINLLDLGHLLHQLTEQALKLLNADHIQVRLLEERSLKRVAAAGKWSDKVEEQRSLGSGRASWAMENQRPLAVKDISQDKVFGPGHFLREIGVKGYLVVPLLSKGMRSIGVLAAASLTAREFTPEEITLAQQLAAGAAVAIENARLFEEVQKKSQELEDTYKTKSDFFNTMAHELRTPLNVLIATQQLFMEGIYGELSQQQKKGFEPMERNTNNLLNLINSILDLARLEAKRVPLQIDEFLLKEITDELESSFMPLAKEKGLDLRFRVDDPTLKLKSDKPKIKTIFQNLLGNAVKYTDKGEIDLRISAVQNQRDNRSDREAISVVIKDTGIGIKETDLPHIFEAFYMAEGVSRRKYPGSGLGLSIVKRLLELLRGDIQVQSEWGKGSTFTAILPLVHSDEPQKG